MDGKTKGKARMHDEDWENIMLKIELDLRSQQYFFMSYLACIRSSIYPRFGGELSRMPSIRDILELSKEMQQTKPYLASSSFFLNAYQYVLEDKTRLKLSKRKKIKYDYLREEQYRSTRDLPPTLSFETQLSNLGGYEIYSLLIGNQSISSTWHGQIRLRPDTITQCLDILLFRYKPVVPNNLYNLPHHKCENVSNFLFRDLPKYEASRLLRISIPVDHIGGLQVLAYPSEPSDDPEQIEKDQEDTLKRPAVLGIDIMHPVSFYTRRINCTHPELNEWKEREDFSKNKLGSTYTRYMFCGPLEQLCKTVGVLMRFRPRLVYKCMKGLSDITEVSVNQFGPDHCPPITNQQHNEDAKEISPEMIQMLVENKIIDPSNGQDEHPLDGYDGCFQDFIDRVHDVEMVEQSLNKEILEFTPPCKVKDYMMDHRGLSGNYYSYCKGKVVGDDTYHCKECKTCAGLDHWHSHSHFNSAVAPPVNKKILYPIPLSGKLRPQSSDRLHINETGNASGVDDMDQPQWPSPKPIEDIFEDGDWQDLRN
eukprot:Phypoly_transcript_05258.p1 GENE.Phypoly_transcript_05258~~Phypoly_transcript_05258.p1  ORF type:complete len:537 (+),score=68.32 Phypoly_transcript_05258:190-1800(+)